MNHFSFYQSLCLHCPKWSLQIDPYARNLSGSQTQASIYLFKVSNRNTGERCEICTKLTIKATKDVISDDFILNIF